MPYGTGRSNDEQLEYLRRLLEAGGMGGGGTGPTEASERLLRSGWLPTPPPAPSPMNLGPEQNTLQVLMSELKNAFTQPSRSNLGNVVADLVPNQDRTVVNPIQLPSGMMGLSAPSARDIIANSQPAQQQQDPFMERLMQMLANYKGAM